MELLNQARAQVRKENFKNFFYKNKKIIKALVVLGFLAAIIFLAWSAINNYRQEKFSEILHQSLIDQQIGDAPKAKENLKKIYEAKLAPSGVRSLASLRYASIIFDEGEKSQAAEIYAEINKCHSCDNYVRELAGLLAVKSWMADENEVKKEDLNARIEKIENRAKLLKYYISEQRAILEMQKNNLEKSYQLFDLIAKSSESSSALKARANDYLKMLGEKGFEPKVEAKKAEKTEEKAVEKSEEKAVEKTEEKTLQKEEVK